VTSVAPAVDAAGVYVATAQGDDDLEMVVIQAHGRPWLLDLDPDSACGRVVYQAEATSDGWCTIPGTGGILGAGDLEPDRIIANLLRIREFDRSEEPVSTAERARRSAAVGADQPKEP
jgi:hypothetical protein